MPALSRRLFHAGADLLTRRTARRLRRPSGASAEQHAAWRGLVRQFAVTKYGHHTGIERKLTYERFRARVPLQTYEQALPWIERAKRGEADVLWPGTCTLYAVSAGTTAGRPQYLPVTPAMLTHFRRAGARSSFFYTARAGHARVFRGRHLMLGGATSLEPIPAARPFRALAGDLSGIVALHLPGWVEQFLYEPGREIARMTDWPAKIDAIIERTWNRDITLIAGLPNWVLVLAAQLQGRIDAGGGGLPHLQALWPNLECLVHGGVPMGPFAAPLRAALGPGVNFHEVYPASEGFIAAQDSDEAHGLRLLAGDGIHYEFLPLRDYRENLADLGAKAVPLEGVRAGEDYVILLTTPAGLARYALGDVVRFISTEPPRLIYVGRTRLQLSAFGEHVSEREVTDTLLAVCRRHDWQIVNFHVAPLFADPYAGRREARHEWWIELKPGTVETPTGPILGTALDVELQRRNDDYAAKRRGHGLGAPVVRLVMPGVFEHWMKQTGNWGGQHKMPRCRSDRAVADKLAELTRFTPDPLFPAGF
jgi:hypothetical protein